VSIPISNSPRHPVNAGSYGIKIGEVRIWSPTPTMIILGVTASPLSCKPGAPLPLTSLGFLALCEAAHIVTRI
jgi:hypothetical protein